MNCSKDAHRNFNHFYGFRHSYRSAPKPCKPLALPRIILLYPVGFVFPLKQHRCRNNLVEPRPMICAVKNDIEFL